MKTTIGVYEIHRLAPELHLPSDFDRKEIKRWIAKIEPAFADPGLPPHSPKRWVRRWATDWAEAVANR